MKTNRFQLNENHIPMLIDEVKENQDLLVEFYKDLAREEAISNWKGVDAIQVDIVIVYAKVKEARMQLEKLGFRM